MKALFRWILQRLRSASVSASETHRIVTKNLSSPSKCDVSIYLIRLYGGEKPLVTFQTHKTDGHQSCSATIQAIWMVTKPFSIIQILKLIRIASVSLLTYLQGVSCLCLWVWTTSALTCTLSGSFMSLSVGLNYLSPPLYSCREFHVSVCGFELPHPSPPYSFGEFHVSVCGVWTTSVPPLYSFREFHVSIRGFELPQPSSILQGVPDDVIQVPRWRAGPVPQSRLHTAPGVW